VLGGLRAHGAQLRGKSMVLHFEHSVAGSKKNKKFDLTILPSDSLWDLRAAVSKEVCHAADRF
jgi:hypothetical protein